MVVRRERGQLCGVQGQSLLLTLSWIGDRWKAIFKDDAERRRFLETLGEAGARTGARVHAFVLMSNHDHLMIETPQANLVAGDALVPDDMDNASPQAARAQRTSFSRTL